MATAESRCEDEAEYSTDMVIRRTLALLLLLTSLASMSFGQLKIEDKTERTKYNKVQSAYTAAKTAYTKSKSAATKKKLVTCTFDLAEWYMYTPALKPKDKYGAALKYYRETLKLDPKHKKAMDSKNTIEQIYKSMNRPIPH